MSAGCAIISNSFVLAKEMLDKDTGVIMETGEESELAEKAIYLLQNKRVRKQMGHSAFMKTRDTIWKKVAEKHVELFDRIIGRPVMKESILTGLKFNC
jgi:glycosyltransferase involved in cell wall biosynthesis